MVDFAKLRQEMVAEQLIKRGISNPGVLTAFRKVPRHLFVPARIRDAAYDDCALPIGEGQTISQPFIVAYMTSVLNLKPTDKVLEVGTAGEVS